MQITEIVEFWRKKYPHFQVLQRLKSGKEADVYLISTNKTDLKVLKLYRDSFLKTTNARYIEGKYFRERSAARAVKKKNRYGKELLKRLWTRREYYLLDKLYRLGANVPEVYDYSSNGIIMEYIGDNETAAPRLKDISIQGQEVLNLKDQILWNIELFWSQGIVHGDLSEFNILYWKGKIYIIDFPQAIDISRNPNAEEVKERDLRTIENFLRI